jgi:ABC-2 type transport system permease protein
MYSIFKREVQSNFFSPFAYVVCAVFMMIFTIAFVPQLSNLNADTYGVTLPDYSQILVYPFSFAQILYQYFLFFVFLIPALTMRSFAEERKSGTEVLLLTTPLDNFQIVLGKFFGIAFIFLVMMIVSLAFPLVVLSIGTVQWSSLICSYIGFFAWGLVCIAVGMMMSALTNSPVIAAVLGEIAMLALVYTNTLAESLKYSALPVVSDVLFWLSSRERFNTFAMGIFSLADIFFYLTMIIVFLSWTIIVLARRRSRD